MSLTAIDARLLKVNRMQLEPRLGSSSFSLQYEPACPVMPQAGTCWRPASAEADLACWRLDPTIVLGCAVTPAALISQQAAVCHVLPVCWP